MRKGIVEGAHLLSHFKINTAYCGRGEVGRTDEKEGL